MKVRYGYSSPLFFSSLPKAVRDGAVFRVPGRIALYGIFRPLRHSPLEQQPPKRTVSQCRVLQILVIAAHFFFIGAATVFFFSV